MSPLLFSFRLSHFLTPSLLSLLFSPFPLSSHVFSSSPDFFPSFLSRCRVSSLPPFCTSPHSLPPLIQSSLLFSPLFLTTFLSSHIFSCPPCLSYFLPPFLAPLFPYLPFFSPPLPLPFSPTPPLLPLFSSL